MPTTARTPGTLRVLLLLLLVLASANAEQRTPLPSLSPAPLAVRLAAAAEPLPLDDLIEAALVFSGVPSSALPAQRDDLASLAHAFQRQVPGASNARTLGEKALSFLHARILRRYDPQQPRVDVALDTGAFNCVSSAVLYLVLARSVGLAVGGVRTADHAFCTVAASAGSIDVETTNPYGFDPGSRREFTDSFGKVTGFAYVPPSRSRDRQTIGEKELLALILYDRASFAIESGDHATAIGYAIDAWTLAGTPLFRQSLSIALTNEAAVLGMAGRYDDGITLLERAEEAFGAEPSLATRRGELLHNWIVDLVHAGSLDEADALLATRPRSDALGASDLRSLTVWVVEARAEGPARRSEWEQARDAIADGLARLGPEPELLSAYEAYAHNVFARLFNAKRFTEARDAAAASLARHPDSRILQQDQDMARQALRQGGP